MTEENLQGRVQGYKAGWHGHKQVKRLTDTWLSDDERAKKLCRQIVQSRDKPDGLYSRVTAAITDASAKKIFDFFIATATYDQEDVSANVRGYMNTVLTNVRGTLSNADDLRARLERAEAQVQELRPYKEQWVALKGELETMPASPLDELLDYERLDKSNE